MEQEKDIVERLRDKDWDIHWPKGKHMALEAAEEIERLRRSMEGTTICPSCKAEFLPVLGQERGGLRSAEGQRIGSLKDLNL